MPLKWENINFNFIFRLSKFGPTSEATLEAENLIAFSLAMQRHFRKAEEHFNEIIKVDKKHSYTCSKSCSISASMQRMDGHPSTKSDWLSPQVCIAHVGKAFVYKMRVGTMDIVRIKVKVSNRGS